MSNDQSGSMRITDPVPVNIQNWPNPPAKDPVIKNTVLRNVVLAAGFDGTFYQVGDYESKRVRMVIIPLDAAIAITDTLPTTSPGTSSVTAKPEGAVLPNGIQPYEFYGPDAMWINQLGTPTRVTVIKEYQ